MIQAPIAVPTPMPALVPVLRLGDIEVDAVGLAEAAVWVGVAITEDVVAVVEIAVKDVDWREDVCVERKSV